MRPVHAAAVVPLLLTWAVTAQGQPQTVLVGGSTVTTGKDVAPAGAVYHVPPNIAEAVIAVAVQGSQQLGIVHGPYGALASGMSAFTVTSATIKNTGGVCVGCHPQGGVGLVQFGNDFYVAYPDTNEHIHLLKWHPGDWPNPTPTVDIDMVFSADASAKTTYAPKLVSHGGSLVLAFRDDNSHLHVWTSALGDFSDVIKLIDTGDGQASDWAPSLASAGGSLILGHQVGDPGCFLFCKNPDLAVSIGNSFNPEVDFSNASMDNAGPGAVGVGGNLFVSWRGQGNRGIFFTEMTTAQLSADLGSKTNTPNPGSSLTSGEQSEHTPNLAAFGDAKTGFTIDILWHDGSTGSTGSDGTNLLFEQIATAPPTPVVVCTTWNANYVDSMLGEDVLGGTNLQAVPASFANFTLLRGTQTALTGALDKNGCVDITDEALNADGTVVSPSTFTLQLDGSLHKNLHSGAGCDRPRRVVVDDAADAAHRPPAGDDRDQLHRDDRGHDHQRDPDYARQRDRRRGLREHPSGA